MEVSCWIVSEAVMAGFVGRRRELAALGQVLSEVQEQVGGAQPGKCLIIRGRRRIGTSALVEEFIDRHNVPRGFFTAETGFGGGSPPPPPGAPSLLTPRGRRAPGSRCANSARLSVAQGCRRRTYSAKRH